MKLREFMKYNKVDYLEVHELNEDTHTYDSKKAILKAFGDLDIDAFKISTNKDKYVLSLSIKDLDSETISIIAKAKEVIKRESEMVANTIVTIIIAVLILITAAMINMILHDGLKIPFITSIIVSVIANAILWVSIIYNHMMY